MIYGLIPIGGKGTRLSLPYSKEMLPQKNFDYFNPIVNHLVEKMELVGASKIVFVHGSEYKQDVVNFFKDERYIHILQERLGFANVIFDFYDQIKPDPKSQILFGLPDSVFNKNPFVEMVNKPGIICGLFTTDNLSKVDRLGIDNKTFQIKTPKTDTNEDWFWGVLKFDGYNLKDMVKDSIFEKYSEIGYILNSYKNTLIYCDSYLDLGTWTNYNRYLTDINSFSNIEIEKKYDATNISVEEFNEYWVKYGGTLLEITSTDFYHTAQNPNIEFVRFREKSKDKGSIGDLTIKNFNKSQLNRFELTIPLADNAQTHNVIHFLNLLNVKYQFQVTKHCYIYTFPEFTVVLYIFQIEDVEFKIIEIELHKIDFNLITSLENKMMNITGFNPAKLINKSKFQIIKEHLNDTPY